MDNGEYNEGQEQRRVPRPDVIAQGVIAGGDPWAYRSKGMKCATCVWYVQKNRIGTSNSNVNPLAEVGRCRRHAPTMNGYPVVYMTDWCGDHRVDENKV